MNFKSAFKDIVKAMTNLEGLPANPELTPLNPESIREPRWIGVFWTPAYTAGGSDETQDFEPGDYHWTHDASSVAKITIRVQARPRPTEEHVQYTLMDLVETVRTALRKLALTAAENDFTCSIVAIAPFVPEDASWGMVRIIVAVGAFQD